MKAALYARVSTTKRRAPTEPDTEPAWKQDPEVQLVPLRHLAESRGWKWTEYQDRLSGVKESRPGLDRLMADAYDGRFKVVIVWKFDRFARTVGHLVSALNEFRVLGIDFISHTELIDTSTPMGRAMFTMIAAFAELERETIRERILAGLDRAKSKGVRLGARPKAFLRDEAKRMVAEGWSLRDVAKAMGVGKTTIHRLVDCDVPGYEALIQLSACPLNPATELAKALVKTRRLANQSEGLLRLVPLGPDSGTD